MNVNVPPTAIPNTAQPMEWPEGALTRIPYWIYQSPEITALEQQRLFEGPVWNFLCLEAEVPKPGDYRVTAVGSMPVVVARDFDDEIYAFENRCASRGAIASTRAYTRHLSHAWNYDLKGNLKAVAFEDGVAGKGGMARPSAAPTTGRASSASRIRGLVFGSCPTTCLDRGISRRGRSRIKRVWKAVVVTGRFTQMLPNNWKLYFENVKDTYHASCCILHDVPHQPAVAARRHGGQPRRRQPRKLLLHRQQEDKTLCRDGLRSEKGFALGEPARQRRRFGDGCHIRFSPSIRTWCCRSRMRWRSGKSAKGRPDPLNWTTSALPTYAGMTRGGCGRIISPALRARLDGRRRGGRLRAARRAAGATRVLEWAARTRAKARARRRPRCGLRKAIAGNRDLMAAAITLGAFSRCRPPISLYRQQHAGSWPGFLECLSS
jgi:hypothetical protein